MCYACTTTTFGSIQPEPNGNRNFSLIYLAAHCEQQTEFLISHLEVTSLLLSLSLSVNDLFSGRSKISQIGGANAEFGPKTYYLTKFLPKTA